MGELKLQGYFMANTEFQFTPVISGPPLLGSFDEDFTKATVQLALNEEMFEQINQRTLDRIQTRIKHIMEAYWRRPVYVKILVVTMTKAKCTIKAEWYYDSVVEISL
ncbi:hypothetical protein MYO4S_00141 [Serratia phage 4S]|nr:hypothetical protein MYO4S_00141 [Serratia phage 4S]